MLRWTILAGVILLTFSCRKSSPDNTNSHPDPGDLTADFTVDLTKPGKTIPPDFTGLSFEAGALPNPDYFNNANTTFINLIKGLGQGVLRVGANTVDRMPWVSKVNSPTNTDKVVTNDDIDRFFSFAAATGWEVMFGLDLGTGTPRAATSEAEYIYTHYSNQLLCFEMGNEPDLYNNNGLRSSTWSYTDFRQEFNNWYDSIRAAVPAAVFAGPTTASNTNTWTVPFVKDDHSRIRLVTQHYYKMGPATNPNLTIAKLLNGNSGILSQARTMAAAADPYHLPYRIAECNSVFGGGKMGISNTLGSALWGLDLMFTLAEQGCAGVNFHGGGAGPYTPISFSQGQFSPRPLYYGMLLFSKTTGGSLLPVMPAASNPPDSSLNLVIHAVKRQDGASLITLINKDMTKQAFVTLAFDHQGFRSATLFRLTGPSPTADTGITFGASVVDANGNWSPGQKENATLTANGCSVKVPAYSAVILILE